MQRVRSQRQAEVIAEGLSFVPERLLPLVGCDFFCGDPFFAGVHGELETGSGEPVERGRSHCCPARVVADGRITVVLAEDEIELITVIHELGHVIEMQLVDERGVAGALPYLEYVNDYSRTCYGEMFAESWVQWLYGLEYADQLMRGGRSYWWHVSRWNCEWWDRLLLV